MIPTLANHLLQSTIFAAAAGLFTLLLRDNQARTRYWLWFAASMKFFLPFSLFVEIGHRLRSPVTSVIVEPQIYTAISQIGQSFTTTVPLPASAIAESSIIPSVLIAIWAAGSGALLIMWCLRWRQAATILHKAELLRTGREYESLHRLNGHETRLVSSPSSIEPGVFGIFRPVLSLPAGISNHLDDRQLDAIVAHELTHIRRRDNLTAILHMLVEAAFWFHPLVWWIGSRLIDERERACDEEVIRLGGDPEVYAESILTICRYYLASPLTCAAGISGSDLKRRIESIMENRALATLGFSRKFLLFSMASLAIAAPVAVGIVKIKATQTPQQTPPSLRPVQTETSLPLPAMAQLSIRPAAPVTLPVPPRPLKFEVASIRENPGPWSVLWGYKSSGPRLTLDAYSPGGLIQEAYQLKGYQVIAADSLRPLLYGYYDIAAKAEGDASPTRNDFRQMLRALLADRFAFTFHREMRMMPAYALVIGKGGPKFKESDPEEPTQPSYHGVNGRNQYVKMVQATMDEFTDDLNRTGEDKPILNETGLTGKYDLRLEATPSFRMNNNPQPDDLSIYTAIQEQLGLKLEEQKRPIEVLVIDTITKPSAN